MRIVTITLASTLILLGSPDALCGQAQHKEGNVSAGDTGRRIVAFVQRAESAGLSGAVLAATRGQVIAAVAVGNADLDGKVPNTPETLFEIGSATKQITAAAVLRLAQQSRLHLDDPIARHLPGVPEGCRAITVQHLLQHTSGIPGTNSAGGGDDLGQVLPLFLRGGPRHSPGTHWEYWNQGYALLSEIIARAAGKDYTEFCKSELFAPAGMRLTRFTGDEPPHGATVAIGRSALGQPRSALDHPYGSYGFQYRGMGGVVTSVWDLWRWDRALCGERVLDADAKVKLFQPGLNGYALGWYVRKDARGRWIQSHSGLVRGFVCELRRYPGEDGCLFVVCNRDDVPVQLVAQALEAILLGEPLPCVEPPQSLDADLIRAISGRYEDVNGATLVAEAEGQVARVRIHWDAVRGPVTRAVLGLSTTGEMVLYEWTKANKIEVDRDGSGPVSRVSILGRQFRRVTRAGDEEELDKVLSRVEERGATVVRQPNLPGPPVVAIYYNRSKATDGDLEPLKGLKQLENLQLFDSEITDAGLAHLAELHGLKTLELARTKITDAGLKHLEGMAKLEMLGLISTPITDAGLAHLKGLTGLRRLHLSGARVTDGGLAHLKGLVNLQELYVSGPQITDAGLEHLGALRNLEKLEISGSGVTGTGLVHLKGLVRFRELFLNRDPVTAAGLANLKGLVHLRTLYLDGAQVTDAGMAHLGGLSDLRVLWLGSTVITAAGLDHLKGLAHLQVLGLSDTKISDAVIGALKDLRGLRELYLSRTAVSGVAATELQRELPGVKIHR
jgi:CubicO group peptidase (beta-lactamase class C family)/Leucine-rich repeat (LRR) protein